MQNKNPYPASMTFTFHLFPGIP